MLVVELNQLQRGATAIGIEYDIAEKAIRQLTSNVGRPGEHSLALRFSDGERERFLGLARTVR